MNKVQDFNPISFYSGGLAKEADIAANLDILRTQYIESWKEEDKEGDIVFNRAWKDKLCDKNVMEDGVRIIVIYGHRGSGKTTLCRRMIYDLNKAFSIPVIDMLNETLAPENIDDIIRKTKEDQGRCLHIFTEIEDIHDDFVIHKLKEAIRKLAKSGLNITIYINIDTNKWKQIETKIGNSILHITDHKPEEWHLRGNFDEREIDDLIIKLRHHKSLHRLAEKNDRYIRFLFRRKAKKRILVSLIEVTRGTDVAQDINEILWPQYQSLSKQGKWAYALVVLFHSFGLEIPYIVMEGALKELIDDTEYFLSESFQAETAEIIEYNSDKFTFKSRHRIIAETLSKRFRDEYKYKIIRAVLISLDLNDTDNHLPFFKKMCDYKIFRTISNLEPLIEDVKNGRLETIQNKNISIFLNSITRIYQGRKMNMQAKELAEKSYQLWDYIANQAFYLHAFCCLYLGEIENAKKAANELIKATNLPYHQLHGIAILRVLREWDAADKALKDFEKSQDITLFSDYYKYCREVDQGRIMVWKDDDIDSLNPRNALDKIEYFVEIGGYDEKTIINLYKKVIRKKHDFIIGYISFFKYLNNLPDNDEEIILQHLQEIKKECEYHISQFEGFIKNYPPDLQSILYSNLARALFKIDYINNKDYIHKNVCEKNFENAIKLKDKNFYAHNWYGTFLKEVCNNIKSAKIHYYHAVKGDELNPVFRYNLALLYYEETIYFRKNIEKAKDLTIESIKLCKENQKWADFSQYPSELIKNINSLLRRTDLIEGDFLDRDLTLLPDAG